MGWAKTAAALGAAAMASLAAAGCDRGASAPARTHDEAAASRGVGLSSDGGGGRTERADDAGARGGDGGGYASRSDGGDRDGGDREGGYRRAREAVPQFHGEPMWSDNRQHTAEENARYHCDKSGADIGAASLDACLTKVHAFIDHPPAGSETLTRANGDRLIYDPKANLFAVARRDGAPRTFFKPRDGAQYWKRQQDEARDGGGYRRRYARSDEGGGEGG